MSLMFIHWGPDYNHRMRIVNLGKWGEGTELDSRASIGMGIKRSWILSLLIYTMEGYTRPMVFNLFSFQTAIESFCYLKSDMEPQAIR